MKLAPEAGLEPATRRLTAGCSTIELLWNPTGQAIYKPPNACVKRIPRCSMSDTLAMRTIKRAPRRLGDAPDRTTAIQTGLSFPVINPQPFLVKIRRSRRTAKIKKPVRFAAAKIQRHGAAASNGLGQHLANGAPQPSDLPGMSVCSPPASAKVARETALRSRRCFRCPATSV